MPQRTFGNIRTGVQVKIPPELLGVSAKIKSRRGVFLLECAHEVGDDMRRNLGRSEHIGPSIKATAVSEDVAELRSAHPGAHAQDVGAFIRPKRGRVIRFQGKRDGEIVYTSKPIRLKGKRYVQKALAPRSFNTACRRAYATVYGDLLSEGRTIVDARGRVRVAADAV